MNNVLNHGLAANVEAYVFHRAGSRGNLSKIKRQKSKQESDFITD